MVSGQQTGIGADTGTTAIKTAGTASARDHHGRNRPTMAAAIRAMDLLPDRDYTFANHKGELCRIPFPELGLISRRLGAGLAEAGMLPGRTVAIMSREPYDSVRCLFAAFAAGIVPVLAYPPSPLADPAAFFELLRLQLASAGVDTLILDDVSEGILQSQLGQARWLEGRFSLGQLRDGSLDALPDPDGIDPGSPALLQFTSGSGSLSKAVVVDHRSLAANSKAILVDGLGITGEDRALCWLPLYHDMGLIGHVVSPVREGLSVSLYPTQSFLKRPSMWMEAISRQRGTITFAPNFAFGLASRMRPARDLDLGHLKVLGCGAEPIHAGTLRSFLDLHQPFGLDPGAIFPCYGLAEHTLAAAFPKVGEGLRTELVSARVYREESRAMPAAEGEEGLEWVSCGRAFPDHRITIEEPGKEIVLDPGRVGEIVLHGPSVASGYLHRDEESLIAFPPGTAGSGKRLRTGDLGYLSEGCLYVTGRQKDLIIINGRNFDPHHIELLVEQVEQVRAGSAFAFSVPGPATERLVVLYETRIHPADETDRKIKSLIAESFGVNAFAVLAHKAQSLPKTSSGKKKRRLARENYLQNDYGPATSVSAS